MNLGIKGKAALVCAASKGLGRACATSLARAGVVVTICSRSEKDINRTADEIREYAGTTVRAITCDITTPDGRDKALAAAGSIDILVNNAGGPPPGDFRNWTADDWHKAVNANMITAIELIKASLDPMIARGFGRIVNITSSSVKSPIGTLGLSNGARSGLTGFCAGLARDVARHNVTINNLLPGPHDTDRLRDNMRLEAQSSGESYDEVRSRMKALNPTGRFGRPEEFGEACAFLCSAQAGYIVGQNLLLDGGAFRSSI
jgi:3-oxoacyl-[acyl-carrier protein] reductase